MAVKTVREALNEALREEMIRDENVYLIGEEVAEYNGAYKISQGLLDEFGAKRVIDTPISESGFTGLSIGAAMSGLRPVVEYMSFNFSFVAIDQILSNAAKMYYMSGGLYNIPIVFRGCNGAASQVSSQHSHNVESLYAHIPGIHVVAPHSPADFKGLLKTSIRSNDPVIFLENEMIYGMEGEVPDEEYTIPLGIGKKLQEGKDVTIIAHSRMMYFAKEAVHHLGKKGISVELIDPRTLKPLDRPLIESAVKKTGRVVIVEEGHYWCGIGSQIAEFIYRDFFDYLDAPIERVAQSENPMPYAKNLESASLPSVEKIITAVEKTLYRV